MGLRSRLVLYVIGLATVVLVIWSFALGFSESRRARASAVESASQVLQALAVPTAIAIARGDDEAVDAVLLEAVQESSVLNWAAVVDEDAVATAHSRPEAFGDTLDQAAVREGILLDHPGASRVGEELLVTVPVLTGGSQGLRWGTLVGSFSVTEVEADIAAAERRLAAGVLGIVLVVGATLWWLLSGLVIKPITHLSHAALKIAEGDLEARVPGPQGEDELGLLANTFNRMAEQMATQTERLETRVRRRNDELEATNVALEQINVRLSRALARLADQANTDGLTGLLNHRAFQEKLSIELQRCLRSEHPLSLLMIDVDHFKAYNDTHGHPAGDQVLRGVALTFRRNLRELDLVARYGGEEFAVILLDTPKGGARLVAEKLRQSVAAEPFRGAEMSQPSGRVTVSIGVSSFPEDGLSPAELIGVADRALYAAKRLGRNRVESRDEIARRTSP